MFSRGLLVLGGVQLVFGTAVQYMGMNIAGFEFGCLIDGTCPLTTIQPPLAALNGGDGAAQMQHFVDDDQMNIFRIPVSWQYLTNNKIGPLNADNFANFDDLMQSCLKTGAACAIDVHNFARFNGGIIGQGGPTNAEFADLWTQLAGKYKAEKNVIFGLMNEPHEIDVPLWAGSVQAAVTAIRKANATSQLILLPGTNFASAGKFVSSGSGDALIKVTNPDGSTTGLVFDLHKYLDIDNSGNHAECVTDNIADAFQIVADYLKLNKRQAIVSETGAGDNPTCITDFCAQNAFLNKNSDVFLGYIAWGAGSFDSLYPLSLTPTLKDDGTWVDTTIASKCVIAPWVAATPATTAKKSSSSSSSASATKSSASTTKSSSGTKTTTQANGATSVVSSIVGSTSPTGSSAPSGAGMIKISGGLLAGTFLLAAVLL